MARDNEEAKSKVNWTALGIGAMVLGAGLLAYKIIQRVTGPSPEQQEEINKLIEMWEEEFSVLKPFVEQIYTPGHTPTDQEIATLNSMMQNMQGKEETLHIISVSGWDKLVDVIKETAETAWRIALSVVVAGFGIVLMVYLFKKIRRPPSSWNCPKCGKHCGSSDELATHISTAHAIVAQNAGEAQESFKQISPWVQNAVAVESAYYGYTFADWRGYTANELAGLATAAGVVWASGIAAASDAAILQLALELLLI
jgi:hypothetical protein